MRHYLQMKAAMPLEKTALFKQTYLIIDSKMQYIDFQIQQYFENCTCPVSFDKAKTKDKPGLFHNLDKILKYVDSLRHDLELLQILKVWLKEETAEQIYGLLKDNAYVNYSSEKLEALLR